MSDQATPTPDAPEAGAFKMPAAGVLHYLLGKNNTTGASVPVLTVSSNPDAPDAGAYGFVMADWPGVIHHMATMAALGVQCFGLPPPNTPLRGLVAMLACGEGVSDEARSVIFAAMQAEEQAALASRAANTPEDQQAISAGGNRAR